MDPTAHELDDEDRQPPRQYLSEMGEVERRYTLAVHDLYCYEEPKGHTAWAHEPFDGVDDPDELVPWSEVIAALARHGLSLALSTTAARLQGDPGLLREALEWLTGYAERQPMPIDAPERRLRSKWISAARSALAAIPAEPEDPSWVGKMGNLDD